jgi:hypothetical protein
MLMTAILLTALNLGQGPSGQLHLAHVRTTYGPLGPTRPDGKILPGDLVCLCFDVTGFQANSAGKVHYGVGLEATDSNGQMVFKNAPSDLELAAPISGQPVPVCAKLEVGLASPPGKYDLKVTVVDRTAGTTTSVTRSYDLLPLEFGIVRVSLTNDREGKSSAPAFSPGQPGWINFTAVGFRRDKSEGQPHVAAVMRVLDQGGRSVLPQPSSGKIDKGVPAQVGAVPMQFKLTLAQPGRFTVELKATDETSGRTATVTFPIQVVASK